LGLARQATQVQLFDQLVVVANRGQQICQHAIGCRALIGPLIRNEFISISACGIEVGLPGAACWDRSRTPG